MKKTLTTLLVLGLLAAVPGTALAAGLDEVATPERGPVRVFPTASDCPPNVKTCIENASAFTCEALVHTLTLAAWFYTEVTGEPTKRDPRVYCE